MGSLLACQFERLCFACLLGFGLLLLADVRESESVSMSVDGSDTPS